MKIERRRVASASIQGNVLEGYAVRFGEPSRPLPDGRSLFIETIDSRAFDRSLSSERSVGLYWNHDISALPLTTTRSGLTLEADSEGIKFSARLADTTQARDVAALLADGSLDGSMSFGFVAQRDEWTDGDRYKERTIREAVLVECSLVDVGAYPNSRAALKNPRRNRALRTLESLTR